MQDEARSQPLWKSWISHTTWNHALMRSNQVGPIILSCTLVSEIFLFKWDFALKFEFIYIISASLLVLRTFLITCNEHRRMICSHKKINTAVMNRVILIKSLTCIRRYLLTKSRLKNKHNALWTYFLLSNAGDGANKSVNGSANKIKLK